MYATILLPSFRLQAILRFAPTTWQNEPVALLASQDGRNALLEVSKSAAQLGIHAGMSPAQALARCPTLKLVHACSNAERNTQDAMLQVTWSLSPKVEAPQPGLCTADLRGCRQEPERAVLQALHKLEALHLSARAGIAPLPNLALLAAHQAKPLLCIKDVASFTAALPLPALTQDTHLLQTLSKWGIHTADELLKLPRQQAIERLGPSVHPLWTAAQGVDNRPLNWAKEPTVYEETLAFEQEIETLEPLLFVLNRFLQELLRRMKGNAHLTSGLHLELTLENRSTYARKFAVPAPTLDAGVLLGILKVHLEQLHLEHRPVRVSLRLEPSQEKAYTMDLFGPALRDPNRFGETLARLCALLGEEHIGIPLDATSHFSDTVRIGPASALHKIQPSSPREQAIPLRGLPLHRLRPAPSVRVDFVKSKPTHIASDTVCGKIIDCRGPYRLSGQWWELKSRTKEEWDICVRLHQGKRRGMALVRIGATPVPAMEAEINASKWHLEGFYNTMEYIF
jgi:protein ImuB